MRLMGASCEPLDGAPTPRLVPRTTSALSGFLAQLRAAAPERTVPSPLALAVIGALEAQQQQQQGQGQEEAPLPQLPRLRLVPRQQEQQQELGAGGQAGAAPTVPLALPRFKCGLCGLADHPADECPLSLTSPPSLVDVGFPGGLPPRTFSLLLTNPMAVEPPSLSQLLPAMSAPLDSAARHMLLPEAAQLACDGGGSRDVTPLLQVRARGVPRCGCACARLRELSMQGHTHMDTARAVHPGALSPPAQLGDRPARCAQQGGCTRVGAAPGLAHQ